MRLIGCQLRDIFKGRYDLVLDRAAEPIRLRLANLHPTDIDTTIVGSSANISVDLENNGVANAPAFEVAVITSVTDPLNNGAGVGMTAFAPIAVASLATGAGISRGAGAINLPNRAQDWDVCTIAIVDPPTSTRAAGSVFESNEGDNERAGCCRVYGPNPDFNGPAAC